MIRYRDRVWVDADDLRADIAQLARSGGTERRFDDGRPLLVLRLPRRVAACGDHERLRLPQVPPPQRAPAASMEVLQWWHDRRAMRSLCEAGIRRDALRDHRRDRGGKTTFLRALSTCSRPTPGRGHRDTASSVVRRPRPCDSVLEWEAREGEHRGAGEITNANGAPRTAVQPQLADRREVRDGAAAREMLMAMQHGHPSLSTVHHTRRCRRGKKLAQYVAQGAEAVEFGIGALLISAPSTSSSPRSRSRRSAGRLRGLRGRRLERRRGSSPPHLHPRARRRGVPQAHSPNARRARLVTHGFDDMLPAQPRRGGLVTT